MIGTIQQGESAKMSMTIAELEQLQAQHPDWQMELVDGSIVVMGPSDVEANGRSPLQMAVQTEICVSPVGVRELSGSH